METNNKILTAAVVAVFLGLLLCPGLILMVGGPAKDEAVEKRQLAEFPAFDADFADHFDAYFADHLGFRNLMIRLHGKILVRIFGTSPVVRAMMGKDDWLFYANRDDGDDIAAFKGINPFTAAELTRWGEALEARRRWLRERGIEYILIVAPSKGSIYPENYPAKFRKIGPNRLNQLKDHLLKHTRVTFIDVRAPLTAAKKEHDTYRKYDTHWNSYGAYVAYLEIMRGISGFFPGLRPLALDRVDVVNGVDGGDLLTMMNIPDGFRPADRVCARTVPQGKAVDGTEARIQHYSALSKKPVTIKRVPHGDHLPALLMSGDSFNVELVQFLSEHFRESIYLRDFMQAFPVKAILEDPPDLVIQEMAERYLYLNKVPEMPPA